MAEYNYKRYDYGTLDEALHEAKKTPIWDEQSRKVEEGDRPWSGVRTWEGAIAMIEEGYPAGLEAMSEAVAITATTVTGHIPGILMDVAGSYPIPALAAAGDPCSMVQFTPWERTYSPIVKIMYECGGHCGFTAKQYLSFGSAMLTIINQLEASNFRVELTAVSTAAYGVKTRTQAVRLKEPEQRLDLDLMGYVMTHISFFRRIVFALMERCPDMAEFAGGYGRPDTIRKEHREPDVIYLQGMGQFGSSSPHLDSGAACLKAMLPGIQEKLLDVNTKMPPLAEWCDVHEIGHQAT